MKDTQHDFGLADAHVAAAIAEREQERSIETSEDEARPLYHPLRYGDVIVADNASAFALRNPTPNLHGPAPGRTHASSLPTDAKARKSIPLYSGLLKYFPDALIHVAHCSFVGNEQHHPGESLHWDKTKSTDHYDCMIRHLVDDTTGVPVDRSRVGDVAHLAKVAWRALAGLQSAIEADPEKFR